jgi:DNA-binding LacI/PurR family transcriptional regulator
MVAEVLTERIRSGMYGPGDLLPAERTLAADLKAHRRSVRIAIEQLVRAGMVSQRPNCRPAVALPNQRAGLEPVRKSTSSISNSHFIALIFCGGGASLDRAGIAQKRLFLGINEAVMRLGYHGVFLNSGNLGTEDENARNEAKHLTYIQEQGFGGALFYSWAYRRNHELVREVSRNVPIVLLDRNTMGHDMDFVGVQNQAGISEIVRHLIGQGHRRIAYVTRREPINTVLDRSLGYSEAMRDSHADGVQEMLLTISHYKDDRAWIAFDAVFQLSKERRPTAVVCLNDYMAALVCERLEYLGLSVPGDVALTGFDNVEPVLPNGIGLTTAAQPFEDMGSKAVEVLMRRINDRKAPALWVELPVRLLVRESSTGLIIPSGAGAA